MARLTVHRRQLIVTILTPVAIVAVGLVGFSAYHTVFGAKGVSFNESGVALGGIPVQPNGIADFSAVLESTSDNEIKLLNVSLIAIPGYPIPRLARVALLGNTLGYPTGTTGWPPLKDVEDEKYPIRPLFNSRVDPHTPYHHLPPTIVYGVVGLRGNTAYAVAGIKITYELKGSKFTSDIFDGGVACVATFHKVPTKQIENWCQNAFRKIGDAQSKCLWSKVT